MIGGENWASGSPAGNPSLSIVHVASEWQGGCPISWEGQDLEIEVWADERPISPSTGEHCFARLAQMLLQESSTFQKFKQLTLSEGTPGAAGPSWALLGDFIFSFWGMGKMLAGFGGNLGLPLEGSV